MPLRAIKHVSAMLAALVICLQAPAARAEELRIGLVPALSPQHFVERFGILARYLERRIGMEVVLAGAPNYAEFVRRAEAGAHYDMIITGSDIFRYLERKVGYRAVARLDSPGSMALIAVRRDSGLTGLGDLAGKTISTADELALSFRLGEKKLAEAGIILGRDATLLATPTQNASMMSMVNGLSDAAIFMSPVLARAAADVAAQVVVIAETERAAPHPLSVAPHVSADIESRLRALLVVMHEDPEGAAFFDAMKWPHFVAAGPGDHASMDWAADALEIQRGTEPGR